jgi:hypothetical protein
MLNNLSEQIRDCLQQAEACARKAAAQPDGSKLRQDFLAWSSIGCLRRAAFNLASDRDDAMTKVVAETIIELAQRGIKSPTALHMTTIKEFKSDPQ